ncbi:TRAP transporter small permease subunit [Flexistipes sinusarabici]|uniref:TRAP transporter small permease n=1 Tax=Flexistipes sinusarabici TaxID=2352 RepID=A0A3D5Q9F2_FLESI|nr:TRAP transporter small permease [Flexistipes sinusarabici]HCW92481.1 TRAP transporter small permease [Flexistipes sinusarabici]
MIGKLNGFIRKVSDFGAFLSSVFMILITLLIGLEVMLRSVFDTTTHISTEYSTYFFIALVSMGLAYTMKENGHIRITLLTGRLKGKAKKIQEISTTVLALIISIFLFYYTVLMTYETYSLGMKADTVSETPIYLSQIAVPLGVLLLNIELAGRLLRIIYDFRSTDT